MLQIFTKKIYLCFFLSAAFLRHQFYDNKTEASCVISKHIYGLN